MKPLAPNTLLQNRYLIVQLIGKGGMGEVYLAVDQRLGSAIAIKRTYFTEDDALGGAFEREARTLARLRHPVLPKVSDHFTENENQYLVMEHISGDDLSKRLESNKKPFPVNWVLFWADQLLDALNYLHSHEPPIIHRDIKPQNLKLTADNQIVLLDFGLAKDSVGQTKITTTGSVVGYTPHYAPMEQIRGTGTNPKSDLYALSATLYQLLTNTVPFDALTRADSLLNGVADPVQPISDFNKEVARPISDIILKGMSVSQEQRYGNAREMQKILRDAYSSMQNQMAAQTIAFNLQDEAKAQNNVSEKTVEKKIATIVNEPSPGRKIEPQSISSDKTEVFSQAESSPNEIQPNFDATMKMDEVAPFDYEPKQADLKTEVFSNDEIGGRSQPIENKAAEEKHPKPSDAAASLISFDNQPKNEKVDDFDSGTNDFSKPEKSTPFAEDFKNSEEKSGEQPDFYKTEIVSGENKTAEKRDFSTIANEVLTGQDFVREELKPRDAFIQNPSSPPPVVDNKKSGGKGLAVAAGLFAILILLGGVGFGSWYVYKNYVAKAQPTPTPEASPSVQITPETTPEPVSAETNSDSNNSNGTIAETGNTNSANINAGETNTSLDNTRTATTDTPRPAQSGKPVPNLPNPRQTPVVTVNNPPRPTPPPRKTPAPQSTPRRTDVIIQ